MRPKCYVFVVDKFSLPVHIGRLFCGVKHPLKGDVLFSLFADMLGIRKGDFVLFYKRRIDEPPEDRGFIGIFKAISEPFIDITDVTFNNYTVLGKCPECHTLAPEEGYKCSSCGKDLTMLGPHILPVRLCIEPIEVFTKYVDDNTAYIDITDPGRLPTLLFRKVFGRGRERSAAPILPEEKEKLLRLLNKKNLGIPYSVVDLTQRLSLPPQPNYLKTIVASKIADPTSWRGKELIWESLLECWLMMQIDNPIDPVLLEILTPVQDLEFFGNQILYGIGGEKTDILVLYEREERRYKANLIELKRGEIDKEVIQKAYYYAYWIAQLATANKIPKVSSIFTIQPIIIGSEFTPSEVRRFLPRAPRKFDIDFGIFSVNFIVEVPILLQYYRLMNTIALRYL